MIPTFQCDTTTYAPFPKGYSLSNSQPYNVRTKKGWLIADRTGVCQCGKPYKAGNEICIVYGNTTACHWCGTEKLAPTQADMAAFHQWLSGIVALQPQVTEIDFEKMTPRMQIRYYEQETIFGQIKMKICFESYRELKSHVESMTSAVKSLSMRGFIK